MSVRAIKVFEENQAQPAVLYRVPRAVDGDTIDVSAEFSRVVAARAISPSLFMEIATSIPSDTEVALSEVTMTDGDSVYVLVFGVGA